VIRRLSLLATTHTWKVLPAAGLVFVVAAVLGAPVTGTLGSSPQATGPSSAALLSRNGRDTVVLAAFATADDATAAAARLRATIVTAPTKAMFAGMST
jgi:hypothetical protein